MDADRLEADLAIRGLLAEYCQLLDDGRFDEWIDLFDPDIVFVVMGMRKLGRDQLRAFIEPAQQADARGLHCLSQPVIRVDRDAATATATTDFVWFARSGEVGQVGRYHDRLRRHEDRWRIASREIVFTGDEPLEGLDA